jgi:hypothetical protein
MVGYIAGGNNFIFAIQFYAREICNTLTVPYSEPILENSIYKIE